jgi:hypothetical protein
MERVLFHDSNKSEALWVKGSTIFPLLEEEEIEALKRMFAAQHPADPQGFYATTHLEDKKKRKEISDKVMELIGEKITAQFQNIQVLGGAFISKAPGEKGILPLHQDWNIVDESKARSYNLWIPLLDVTAYNGAMRVLEGSHRKQTNFRGPNIPPVLYQISEEVEKHMHSLDMKKGEALLYDHALWHSSPLNQSNELRLAIVLGVIPKGCEMKYYYAVEGEIEEYDSHPNFFFENDRDKGPQGLSLSRRFKANTSQLSEAEFYAIYLNKEESKKKNIFASLFRRKRT